MATTSMTEERPHKGVLSAFEKFEREGQERTPSWLQALHKGGIAHFAELGFPTREHEEWRFTNVAPIARMPLEALEAPAGRVKEKDLERFSFKGFKARRLVFVDGFFSSELSSKIPVSNKGLKILNLEDAARGNFPFTSHHLGRYARYDDNPFAALNTAFLRDGAVVLVPARQVEEEPIHIIYVSTGAKPNAMTNPRTLIIAQTGSQAKVVEQYVSLADAPSLTNAVTEIVVEENAVLEHCKIQEESSRAYHVATIQTHQGRASNLISHSISMGGSLARNTITCALEGEKIECTLNGLYLGADDQLVDHHTAIHHNQPNCNSHEYYHGILDGRSTGVFNGKIFVRPEAQKTDAKQNNKNLLLSDDATVNTKPQLEIFADDVKCTHGATIGQLDEDSIFYLRARGIGLENARKMLLHAFASEIVNRISMEPVRDTLNARLFEMYERD